MQHVDHSEDEAASNDIVALAYESVLAPGARTTLLHEIRAFLDADALVWLECNGADRDGAHDILQCGLDPATMGEYARLGWASPLAPGLLRAAPCRPLTNSMLVAPGELEASVFYQEWVRPNRVTGVGLIGMLAPLAGRSVLISAMRGKSAPHAQFDEDGSAGRFGRLLPHLARAHRLSERLTRQPEAPAGAGAASDALLDALTVAAISLDRRGMVAWANSAAEDLLRRGDGVLASAQHGLQACAAAETDRLRKMLAGAAQGTAGSIRLSRPSGEAPLSVLAMPGPAAGPSGPAAAVLVFLFTMADGLAGTPWLLQQRLRTLHGLTATEALVCVQLAGGSGVPATAAAMHLEPSTIRSHARQVFAKIGVHGQVALAAAVARLGLVGGG